MNEEKLKNPQKNSKFAQQARNMKITQKDIAQKVGVSTSLVSRVLSGQAHKIGVHPRKIEEIMRVAKEMKYVPSPAALALKGKKSRTIGIVAYDFYSPYFSLLISELQELSHIYDYSLLLVGFLNRKPKESDLIPLYKHSVDGIIILGSFGDLSWTNAFKDIPIARVGHGEHPDLRLSISVDEFDAMQKILTHLTRDLSLKSVAFAFRSLPAHQLRLEMLKKAAKDFGCRIDVLPPSDEDQDFRAGSAIARALLKDGAPLPSAIICATDLIAMGVIKKFHESGVKVPENVAIVGFDDVPEAANYIPSVTSFRQPIKEYAKRCFSAIVEDSSLGVVELEGELLVRSSTISKG